MTVARRDPEKADLVYGDVMVGREGIEPSTNGLKVRGSHAYAVPCYLTSPVIPISQPLLADHVFP